MGFDWFTLVAQLVNFVLLLVLLRVFLYRPVLGVMQQREERLAATWAEAERALAEARAEAERLAADRAALEAERRARVDRIEGEMQRLRDQRLAEVEAELEADRARRLASLERARQRAVERLRHRSAELLLAELRASLTDLADAELEERVTAVFARRLAALEPERLEQLRAAAKAHAPVVTTAFPASAEQRERLAALLRDTLGGERPPRFESDERLLFGVELTVGALRVAASGRQRVAALEVAFDEALSELASLAAGGAHGA